MTDKAQLIKQLRGLSFPGSIEEQAADALDALLEENAHLAAGPYRYLCTKGHHVVSKTRDDLATCDAVVPWPGGEPCGAQLTRYEQEWRDDLTDALDLLREVYDDPTVALGYSVVHYHTSEDEDGTIVLGDEKSREPEHRWRRAARLVLEQQESER